MEVAQRRSKEVTHIYSREASSGLQWHDIMCEFVRVSAVVVKLCASGATVRFAQSRVETSQTYQQHHGETLQVLGAPMIFQLERGPLRFQLSPHLLQK